MTLRSSPTPVHAQAAPELNPSTYEWSVRLFNSVRRALKINIKMHFEGDVIERGEIFLFNHFARFETFIPQYLIFRECGAYCRSVASADLFRADERLAGYLTRLGAVPNDHPRLLPLLAVEILHGRKVVIFPEGGMVKDRQVLDDRGRFSVYSRRAQARRKHHAGAAVLANGLEALRAWLRAAAARGEHEVLEQWAGRLGFEHVDALLAAAARPTTVVPANITFYPLRAADRGVRRVVERFTGTLSARAAEELVIESNLLLQDTDMDIRLGEALEPAARWRWRERWSARHVGRIADQLEDFFARDLFRDRLRRAVFGLVQRRSIDALREESMRRMYAAVTINLSHLASRAIQLLVERGDNQIGAGDFARIAYLAVKNVQGEASIHLHRSLRNPEAYAGLVNGRCAGLEQFLASIEGLGLLRRDAGRCHFADTLTAAHGFDSIRLENPVAVYANEAAPLAPVEAGVRAAVAGAGALDARALAALRFDDELRAWHWDREIFRQPRYQEINDHETAIESGEPFLFLPHQPRTVGVVLAHGLLASPAEMRAFGEKLAERGYPVVGPRLSGHGTSPWDLRGRDWNAWLDSVRRAYRILAPFAERLCLVGFSTGGALSLVLAGESPPGLAGVVTIAAPLRYRNRNMVFVPLMHGANRLVRSMSPADGIMPFRLNNTEHPHINYRHVPIRALYELRRLTDALEATLPRVTCPVKVLQATGDRVVDPRSADLIYDKLGSEDKSVVFIPADRHGILNEDIGDTHAVIEQFLLALEQAAGARAALPADPASAGTGSGKRRA